MTVITLSRPTAPATSAPAPRCFAAPDAFRILRAWRAWAARSRDTATTTFTLVRGDEGTLVLAGDGLSASSLTELSLYSHRRVRGVGAPAGVPAAVPSARDDAPVLSLELRSLDDWALEVLLRTTAALTDSLVVGLRHCAGRFELLAWSRRDGAGAGGATSHLFGAMVPWIAR